MTDHSNQDQELQAFVQNHDWESAQSLDEPLEESVSPLKMVMDRMHGRWLWAILLGLVLSPIFAYVGWSVAPVKYDSIGTIQFKTALPALMEPTLETSAIEVEMEANRQSVASNQVLFEALGDPILLKYRGENISSGFAGIIADGLVISVPRRSNMVIVKFVSDDPQMSAGVVSSILKAYQKIHAPSPEVELADKQAKVKDLARAAEAEIDDIDQQRRALFENNRYGRTEVDSVIDANTTRLRELEIERLEIQRYMNKIVDLARLEGRDPDPENPDDRILPVREDLQLLEPQYARAYRDYLGYQANLQSKMGQLVPSHPIIRRLQMLVESQKQQLTAFEKLATERWLDGPGKGLSYGILQERLLAVDDESRDLRSVNADLSEQKFSSDKLLDSLDRSKQRLANYESRLSEMTNESDAVKEGRIQVNVDQVVPSLFPSKDRRSQMALAGAVGGFGVSFLGFFLLGSVDQKTYGVRQLTDASNSLRTLGVMPNMDEVDESPDTVNLATDCVHRIRSRIESRRSPETGYAMMVSSPFQGDGKTTLAISLGWSYAESGYRTVIVDADFIGRSMTHQFGRLRQPGLREIVRSGKLNGEVVELGHANLNLLGVGFDRRVSAANLNPGVLRRVIESLREEFDMIIIDTGPMTASIEALPVASASDGVVLALRRGRSRVRLEECINDIKTVGADYLGIVLNYADQADCMRYGSTSRTSMEVIAALEAGGPSESVPDAHPLIGNLPHNIQEDKTD